MFLDSEADLTQALPSLDFGISLIKKKSGEVLISLAPTSPTTLQIVSVSKTPRSRSLACSHCLQEIGPEETINQGEKHIAA